MKIDVRINSLQLGEGNIKANAAIRLNESIEIRNVRVMNGKNGLFASMPSYKDADGDFREICSPCKELRAEINAAVVDAYNLAIGQMQGQTAAQGQYGGNFNQSEQSYEAAPTMSM